MEEFREFLRSEPDGSAGTREVENQPHLTSITGGDDGSDFEVTSSMALPLWASESHHAPPSHKTSVGTAFSIGESITDGLALEQAAKAQSAAGSDVHLESAFVLASVGQLMHPK